MKKIFIILVVIICMLFVINIRNTIAYDANLQSFSLIINKNNEEIYKNENELIEYKYSTIFINMDTIFSNIFKEYNIDNSQQTLIYNNIILEIDKEKKNIKVPNIRTIGKELVDDSVDVEIEEINGQKYVPIYLISNITGIETIMNGNKIYDNVEYYNSSSVINNQSQKHTIYINCNEMQRIEENSSDDEYVGEQLGALWREEAYKRIEKYRKNNVEVIVKNQNDKIIENANINMKMIENEFKFGTAIRYRSANMKNVYEGITKKLFNGVLSENAFKWIVLDKEGSDLANDIIQFAKTNKMYLRGHCLWWDYAVADTLGLIGDKEDIQEGTMAYVHENYKNGKIDVEEAEQLIGKLQEDFESTVLKHIEDEITEFPDVQEWDVINEPIAKQYFKYYLYDKKMLEESNFLDTTKKQLSKYDDNEKYYQFLAKCFDKARETKGTLKLVLNTGQINGNSTNTLALDTIRIVNNIKKYTNNIDALGIQSHINNKYQYTPQSYYNQINNTLEQIGINEAVITEYDNYVSAKIGEYTDLEKKKKADYLRDFLIAEYSNKNVKGFYFWVYNSTLGNFEKEEWQAYEELMKEWLNDEQNGKTDSNGNYSTRLYKGEYTAKVKINNLEKEVPIIVSDNTEPVEIIINSNLEKISIKQKPNKIEYIQDKENFDAGGGVILAHYDDGTVEEIDMSSDEVELSKLDNSILGKQTIIVTYKDKKVTFVVDVVEQSEKRPVVDTNEEISEISIIKLPEKVEYIQNKEKINLKTGKLLITYKDGTTKEISMNDKDVSVSGFDNSIVGERAIRITYKGKQTTFVVYIVEDTSSSDDTIANKNLPNAGIRMTIIMGIFIIGVMAIV